MNILSYFFQNHFLCLGDYTGDFGNKGGSCHGV